MRFLKILCRAAEAEWARHVGVSRLCGCPGLHAANLGDFGLLPRGSPAELVELDVEPLVDLSMDSIVLVTNLLAGQALLHGLQQHYCV